MRVVTMKNDNKSVRMIDWWIIEKSLRGQLTGEERRRLENWLGGFPSHRQLYERIKASERLMAEIPEPEKWRGMFERRLMQLEYHRRRRLFVRWGSVAALFVMTLAAGYWWALHPDSSALPQPLSVVHAPDGAQVRLYTAEGEVMNLSDAGECDTLTVDGLHLVKEAGGISYQQIAAEKVASAPVNNRIEVPRCSEFYLTLNDGSKVWLNADSRLSYPVVFVGETREVELQGEAYFEVARDVTKPFIVRSGGVAVKVLGTEFNVNTRLEGSVRTLLVAGKVEVGAGGAKPSVLHPGEMAVADGQTGDIRVGKVNVQKYTAWRHGGYYFESATMEEMFEELSLWYDVEVEFQSERVRGERFSGYLRRGDSIFSILKKIEKTTYVRFHVVGKKIVVK